MLLIAVHAPHPANVLAGLAARAAPLGVACLGAALARANFRVSLIDMNAPPCPSDWVVRYAQANRPRLIGLSCATESAGNALRLARRLRHAIPDSVLVTGGPHWSFLPEFALSSGLFDAVALREADETVVEMAAAICGGGDLAAVRGIVLFVPGQNGSVLRTPARALVENLDSLPFPARDLFVPFRLSNQATVLTGRGCPGRCVFCTAAAMSGGRRRVRSAQSVIAELVELQERGVDSVFFVDDTITADPSRLAALLDLIEAERLQLKWACESRVDAAAPKLLSRMSELGCVSMQFGVESGCQELLDALGKGTSLGQVECAVAAASAAGITPVCSFIIGHPWDTEATIAASLDFALGLQRRYLVRCGFALLVPFPGTRLWRQGRKLGLHRLTGDFDLYTMHTPVCATTVFDAGRLRARQFEVALNLVSETSEEMAAMLPQGVFSSANGKPSSWREWF